MTRIKDGTPINLPNGDVGIVQGFVEGKYLVFPTHGIGKARYIAPEDIEPPVDQQLEALEHPTLFDLKQYTRRDH